jgi:hypothetical protein
MFSADVTLSVENMPSKISLKSAFKRNSVVLWGNLRANICTYYNPAAYSTI